MSLTLFLSLGAGVLIWVGGLYHDREDWKRRLRVILPSVGFVLLFGADWQMQRSEDDFRKRLAEQAVDNAEATAELNERIADLARENASLNEELAAYARGKDSYFYLHVEDLGKQSERARIMHVGDYPVRNATIEVFDVSEQHKEEEAPTKWDLLEAERVYKGRAEVITAHGQRKLERFPFRRQPERSRYAFAAIIHAENVEVHQTILFEQFEGSWEQHYSVAKVDSVAGTRNVVKRYYDPNKLIRVLALKKEAPQAE